MRLWIVLPFLCAAGMARAAAAATPAPTALGTFQNWTAATYVTGGEKICYAFTRPLRSSVAVPGRGQVLLSVTERPGSRDEAAVTAGFAYPKDASVTVDVGATKLSFYTSGNAAFARDGTATVAAFKAGNDAAVHSPTPHGGDVTDTFSLSGFTAAYGAITQACRGK